MFMMIDTTRPAQEMGAISPLEMDFDADQPSPILENDPKGCQPRQFVDNPTKTSNEPTRHHSSVSHISAQKHSPTTKHTNAKRRRRSEPAEVGTERAIYLEKNRKAASKCRNKQRKEQEDLVEEARNVERRNKVLRSEVEMLRGGMHQLMEIAGQHTNCPDSRLRQYLEREADRLAARHPHATSLNGGSMIYPEPRQF
ncbi:hypothetical protein GQ44DRAFT_706874 [Phaeosphaeriaceae sp. PMI808]|nr:hypothetical protein GQ44DRAFT_706874 [Phaeosphaeriaceae sp. PMI808]